MQRRKFLATVGSLTAGTAAAMGTGAFSSATAERDVIVEMAGDESAYVGLEAGTAPGVSPYVDIKDGELIIKLDYNGEGYGVNKGAVTEIGDPDDGEYETEYAFKLTNQGTQPIFVGLSYDFDNTGWLEKDKDQSYIEFEGHGNWLEQRNARNKAQFPFQAGGETAGGEAAGGTSGRVGSTQAIWGQNRNKERATLGVGDAYYFVVRVDTSGDDASMDDDLSGVLTIHAESDDEWGVMGD